MDQVTDRRPPIRSARTPGRAPIGAVAPVPIAWAVDDREARERRDGPTGGIGAGDRP